MILFFLFGLLIVFISRELLSQPLFVAHGLAYLLMVVANLALVVEILLVILEITTSPPLAGLLAFGAVV